MHLEELAEVDPLELGDQLSLGLLEGNLGVDAERFGRLDEAREEIPYQLLVERDAIFVRPVLGREAVGDRVSPIFVDTGLLRKDEGERPQHIDHLDHPVTSTWVHVYKLYQDYCNRGGLVDFAELLLRAHELWLENPAVLDHYRRRLQHLLIDEFQDTNAIQYAWLRMLAGDTGRVFVVGDDDQSIYGWRGAKVENVQHFVRDFPDVQTIRLEQNYRSTQPILEAANCLIAESERQHRKNLYSTKDGVAKPRYVTVEDGEDGEDGMNCTLVDNQDGVGIPVFEEIDGDS